MDVKAGPDPPQAKGTWDCVDPCALLILLREGFVVQEDDILRTLNAYGWMDGDSEDVARAQRQHNRFGGGANDNSNQLDG